MIQKVLQVGSSAAVTIPKGTLKELGIAVGDQISVSYDKEKNRVIIESPATVDAELVDWTKKFIKEYRPVLEALKDQ